MSCATETSNDSPLERAQTRSSSESSQESSKSSAPPPPKNGAEKKAPSKKSPPPKDPWDTPAMRQWTAIKKSHPECVLFFRMGDFYELFGEDAENLSRDLGISLTTRNNSIPMAGVPHHQKEVYLQRAIDQGYRVAVVDQLQDPKDAKGVVDRGVTQVVTPGTLVDESLLSDEQRVPIGSIAIIDDHHAGIAVIELSTGSFQVFNGTLEQCQEELARCDIRELICSAPVSGDTPPRIERIAGQLNSPITGRPGWQFRSTEALESFADTFGVSTLDGFGLEPNMPSVLAAGALLRYLNETQAIDPTQLDDKLISTSASLSHLRAPTLIDRSSRCLIDAVSLRSLEIEQTIREQSIEGSLAGVFLASPIGTRCVLNTPMGKRLIREWLTAPLTSKSQIELRQRAIEALINDPALSSALIETLKSMCDIARIAGRLALNRATPRDLSSLGQSTVLIGSLVDMIDQSESLRAHKEIIQGAAKHIQPVANSIVAMCVDEPPAHLRAGGLIKDGVDPQLDEARGLEKDAGVWLANYQAQLSQEHDLPSIKVGYNKVFGYYIELPAAQSTRAPAIFTRKQTLKNAERYITPELKEFEEKVLSATDIALEREKILFDQLCQQTRTILGSLSLFSDTVASLDCLIAMATKARDQGWIKPEIREDSVLDIQQGRHPVLAETLGQQFIPNNCTLRMDESANDSAITSNASLALITGPNMAGKSTYIRQNALLVALAQTGSYIPAEKATIGISTRIFTRVGADDALHRGQSTFMVEMIETANILNNADERSLIILDEIGRGTSTLDGLSLAWAICESLAHRQPRTLFATHYHEITQLEELLEHQGMRPVKNLHVAVREWTTEQGQQEIAFLHSIRAGKADQSYGIHVAQLAGVPREVTKRANQILQSLSVKQAGRVDSSQVSIATSSKQSQHSPAQGEQLGLFTEYVQHPVIDALRELKLESLTPMDAFDLLRDLHDQSQS